VKELLDVVTRVYEYQRPYPALVGTASGLETVRLALQGKLPTPPIIATLGISLVDASEGRCVFEGSPAEWQLQSPRNRAWRLALRTAPLRARLRGPNRLPGGCGFTTLDLHVRFVRAATVAISRLRAEAQVTHVGKRTATAEGRVIGPVARSTPPEPHRALC
jgi:hypothetical protein